MLLVIDNYDSFTFNLVQYLGELAPQHPVAADLRVERNDALNLAEIRRLNPKAILLSPGPGDPNQSGVCLDILRDLSPTCLLYTSPSPRDGLLSRMPSSA